MENGLNHLGAPTNSNNPDDLRGLLEKNIALNEEVLKKVKYIKKYIFWQRIFGVVKVLIIIIPLALGFIYLPPLLKQLQGTYQELLNTTNQVQDINNNPDLQKLLKK